jgi:hypothetical protein
MMARCLIICISILTIACTTKVDKENYSFPDKREILEIIETIIKDKKLPVKRDTVKGFHLALASALYKLEVFVPDTNMRSALSQVPITRLLKIKVNKRQFFSKKDSAFFLYQNDIVKVVDLHNELDHIYYLTTPEQEKLKKGPGNSYYDMSVPIFSKDLKKAYVEVNDNCKGLCGSGGYYLLEKIKNKWTIVDYHVLWIS